jgi:lipopolysaccharide export system protein LptA
VPIAASLSLIVLAAPVRAQGIDFTRGGPIQITARDGIDWRQAEQMVIAKGDAKAVRADATVTADRLIAWYRRKGDEAAAQPTDPRGAANGGGANGGVPNGGVPNGGVPKGGVTGATSTEGNEVYRMRAEGNVHIYTATDQGWADQATYDLDQAVLVMTGHALKLTNPNDTLTARDTVEYWSRKHMAVARGDAVVVTADARRISADTLVAYTLDAAAAPAAAPNTPPPPARPGDSVAEMAGKLERVEAFNNVSIRTATDIVTGDRAVYVPDTGIAHLGGHVRISRGGNQVNGSEAVVNMKTGVATLLAGDSGRVTGLVIPNDQSNAAASPSGGNPVGNPAGKSAGSPSGPPAGVPPKPGASP